MLVYAALDRSVDSASGCFSRSSQSLLNQRFSMLPSGPCVFNAVNVQVENYEIFFELYKRSTLERQLNNEKFVLNKEDTFSFTSTIPHQYHNPGDNDIHSVLG